MVPANVEHAREFLRSSRIAVVGVSRHPKDFSRTVFRELLRRGLDVVPVNPAVPEVEGRPCFTRVQDIRPPADAALLLTAPSLTEQVLRDCLAAGIRRVWLHRGAGPGAATPSAIAFCEASGIDAVRDLCPFMALEGVSFPHRLHGFVRRRLTARAARS